MPQDTAPGRTVEQGKVELLHGFNFVVEFLDAASSQTPGTSRKLCDGAFSEVTGLEATVEPFAVNEGGRNWGQIQRVGRTTFATVILRRGLTPTRHLVQWFQTIHRDGKYKHRLDVVIHVQDNERNIKMSFRLKRALPVKLKLADLNAAGQELAIEELHLVHEGLTEELPGRGGQSGEQMTSGGP